MKIENLSLNRRLKKNLSDLSIRELTAIQSGTFEKIIEGQDLIGVEKTGSGKTLAFLLPTLERMLNSNEAFDILVLEPTRELVNQVMKVGESLVKDTDIHVNKVTGRGDVIWDKEASKRLIVATPGGILKELHAGSICLKQLQVVVTDEADEFIQEGFLEELLELFSNITHECQKCMFSATMNKKIESFITQCMIHPVVVNLLNEKIALKIEHKFQLLLRNRKFEVLKEKLNESLEDQTLIFCNSKFISERVYKQLKNYVKEIAWLSGDLEQAEREEVINRFRCRDVKVLVATDVAARGVDILDLKFIVNYDLPQSVEIYTHRSGRTGRMGKEGNCLTFVEPEELLKAKSILDKLKFEIHWVGPTPDFEAEKRKGYAPQKRQQQKSGNSPRFKEKRKYR